MLVTEQQRLKSDIAAWVEKYGYTQDNLIPILQEIQTSYAFISESAMQIVADYLDIHPSEVYSVVSFYSFLDHTPKGQFVFRLCRSLSCEMADKDRLAQQLENDLGIKFGQTTPDGWFSLEWTNCLGMCDQGPALLVNDQMYTRVTPGKASAIISACRNGGIASIGKSNGGSELIKPSHVNSFTFSTIAPNQTLKAALEKSPAEVVKVITDSQIKGRGGAGFPTGVKWSLAAAAKSDEKYVICNADEGEPGTFKDRLLLSDYADLVFEGMTIGAYVIGASKGFLYLRAEYTYLKNHLENLLQERRQKGLLGADLLGKPGFTFDIEIRMGAGAYVCGEESALIESLEGSRGEPRNRPPFPVDNGFGGKPSIVNNVETFAWVTAICTKGADWFKNIGTGRSAGLKLFSVSGDCQKPGVYELPLGITIQHLLETVGGTDAKAVQIGGASGQCIPASEFGRKIAFEDVATGGSVMVIGPQRDMLDVAKNFLEFFVEESCGQCTPCREGNAKLLEGVEKLYQGTCSTKYLSELCALGETMQIASKCGLGQSSPNAFLSIVKNFKDELTGRPSSVAR
jgi:[NiFe] hydrogenase diaphorase moiety large subunit